MITAGILQFFFLFIYVLLSPLLLLNNVGSNSDIATGISNANGYLAGIPFHYFLLSLVASLVFLILFEAGFWGYKGIRWIYTKVPGVS